MSGILFAPDSEVVLLNGVGNAEYVYWQVGATVIGSILVYSSITATIGVTVNGRLLARVAAVTITSSVVSTHSSTAATAATAAPAALTTLAPSAVPNPAAMGAPSAVPNTAASAPTAAPAWSCRLLCDASSLRPPSPTLAQAAGSLAMSGRPLQVASPDSVSGCTSSESWTSTTPPP